MFPNAVMTQAARPGTTFCARMIAVRDAHGWELDRRWPKPKKLNIGLVGYGFMGRTHSNAFRRRPQLLRRRRTSRC